ncbi:MAG: hypothetical protein DRQ60_08700 [Gammaproteobacteria bacterium]|nr:MAG: hypothetical protein DRQ60_08700 [Gammaproteobacteria bacterium]
MAYQSGQIIEASNSTTDDFNELAALINEVYGDSHSGDHAVATGTFGYGQSPEIATVAAGDVITAAQWTEIFSSLAKCANHQGTPVGAIPGLVTTGDIINIFDSPNGTNDLINDIRTNKLLIDPSEAAITLGGSKHSETRSTSWTSSVTHEFDVEFTDEDEARHFFNAGGEIHWSGQYSPGGSEESGEEADWALELSNMGTVAFNYNNTTAGAGATFGIGYYDIIETYQTIADKSINGGGGYYVTEGVTVAVKATDSSMNVLRFKVVFATDPDPDRVLDGELVSMVDQKISVNNIASVEPTYSPVIFIGS